MDNPQSYRVKRNPNVKDHGRSFTLGIIQMHGVSGLGCSGKPVPAGVVACAPLIVSVWDPSAAISKDFKLGESVTVDAILRFMWFDIMNHSAKGSQKRTG